jgi:hypothetical protein
MDRLLAYVDGQLDLLEAVLKSPATRLHAACNDIHIAASAFKKVLEVAACETLDFKFRCAIEHVARRLALQRAALRQVSLTYEQRPARTEQPWAPTGHSRIHWTAVSH